MAVRFLLNFSGPNDSEQPFPKTASPHGNIQTLINLLKSLKSRTGRSAGYVVDARQAATLASGTLTLSTASGTVGGIINGVTVTVTASGGDTATATAIAAAINASANALVKNIVTATSAAGVVTVTATHAGVVGNCVTLAASGTGVTASGARLTGGAETVVSISL